VSTPDKIGEKPTSLRFGFHDSSDDGSGDPEEICGLDIGAYRDALTAAGFSAKPMLGYRGIDALYFTRGEVGVTIHTHGHVDPDAGRACVSTIVISAYA